MIKDEFTLPFFFSAKNKMSFIYQKLRDRERTYIKEKVKSRDKYTCSEFPNDPVEKTGGEYEFYFVALEKPTHQILAFYYS